MQRAHKRKIKVLVVDAAMMFAAVQMTVCMHGKQRYTASAQDVSGYEVLLKITHKQLPQRNRRKHSRQNIPAQS